MQFFSKNRLCNKKYMPGGGEFVKNLHPGVGNLAKNLARGTQSPPLPVALWKQFFLIPNHTLLTGVKSTRGDISCLKLGNFCHFLAVLLTKKG